MANEEYVVEDILGEKYDRSRQATVYEIKWKGFPSDENTWETRDDMIADGYEKEILAYEARKASGVPTSAKKKTPARNARSKTPIKRTVAVKDSTPGRKLDYSIEEKPVKSTPVSVESETVRDSLKHLLIGGAIMATAVALAREKDAFPFAGGENFALALPAFVGLLTLQVLGRNADAVSRSSIAMLWMAFSLLLSSPLLPESPLLMKLANLAWRLFFAFSVGADIRDANVTFVTLVTWFVCTGMSLSFDFSKLSLLFSVWASITAIDKWTERRTLLNFIEALSTCSVIVTCFTSEDIYLWTAVVFLVISNVARA